MMRNCILERDPGTQLLDKQAGVLDTFAFAVRVRARGTPDLENPQQ